MSLLSPILISLSGRLDSGPIDWSTVQQFIFSRLVFEMVAATVILSVVGQSFGSLIGLGLYFLRRSRNRLARGFANVYIWIFRGTPLIVQIVVIWQMLPFIPFPGGGSLATKLDYGVNLTEALNLEKDYFLSGVLGAMLALALNEGAYMAEIVRAGIDSIEAGQMEAAKSLGMTYGQAMRRVVLPQALRVIVPPLGNEFNSMLKSSSLASAASVWELYFFAYSYGKGSGQWLTFALIAVIWYLALTTVWGFIQAVIERRLNVSNLDPAQQENGFLQRLLGIRGGGARPEVPGVAIPLPVDHR